MYVTPTSYRPRVESPDRDVAAFMSIGIDVDNTAADDITAITGSFLPLSNGAQLYDANYYCDPYLATFEADGIPTQEDAGMLAPPMSAHAYPPECAAWSSQISDASGNISATLTFEFAEQHTSALTVYTVGGPNVTSGTVDFYLSGTATTVALECHNYYAVAHGSHVYDRIVITITAIDAAYKHMRFSEVEFGDSITVNDRVMAGELVCIQETDVLQASMPMSEVDFSLANVMGEYDLDNPEGRLNSLKVGSPIYLSMTVSDDTESTTIPIGRYYIAEKVASDERMDFTCYDIRWNLSRTCKAWSLPSTGSLSSALATQFTALEVPYDIDASVDSISSQSVSFDADSSMLDDMLSICQKFGVYMGVDRYGDITVTAAPTQDDYGTIPQASQYTWPEADNSQIYNYIEIQWASGSYSRDLRTSMDDARNTLSLTNRTMTEAEAQAMADRIQANVYTYAATVEWLGDPAMDLNDKARAWSRWTVGTPEQYRCVKQELTYDGSLKAVTTFVK